MSKSLAQWPARIGVILQLLLGSSFAFGQVVGETKTIDITVDDSRPMAAAILQLEELSGIPINYEDMPLYYSADFENVTVLPTGQRVGFIRGGRLSVPIAVDASTGKLNDVQAVKDALAKLTFAYNSSGLPDAFDFEYYKGVFFVKPVRYRDASGATQTMKSLLSTPITLSQEKMNLDLGIRRILLQVSQKTGSWAGMGWDLGLPWRAVLGSTGESADHLIARFVALGFCANGSSSACTPAHTTSEDVWDIGISYDLLHTSGLNSRKEYILYLHQVANSRWSLSLPSAPSPPSSPGEVVQETEAINITVDDVSPMDATIAKIEELSGIPINYEDMPLYYASDLYDAAATMSRTPRRWHFSVSIAVDAVTGTLNDFQAVKAALTAVVSAYNSSNLPGNFEVESYNGVFFVKPVQYRDATGATKPMTPVMSTPITLPQESRSRNQVLQLILDQLAKKTGFDIHGPASVIQNMDNELTFGADGEPASHVMARFWSAGSSGRGPGVFYGGPGTGLSYHLYRDRQERAYYALNVRVPSWNMPPPRPQLPPLPRKSSGAWTVPLSPYSPPPRRSGNKPGPSAGARRVP
ncbi:MAG: hypothetical protein HYS38_00265 [Acidobacteria bacterium]|nr:hypothetical protein [Acidobacteriota bacterium]